MPGGWQNGEVKWRFASILALFVGALVPVRASSAAPDTVADVVGLWSNPKKSVYVRTDLCGDRLCGEIVCATQKAIAKAAAKGTERLIGTQVFEDYRRRTDGRWKGKVFVPDRGDHFESKLKPLDDGRLEIKGCIIGGLICKEQVWQRAAPGACDTLR